MKKLLSCAVFVLAGCGSKLDGTYADDSGMTRYEFNPSGKVTQTTMGVQMEMHYKVEGKSVKIVTPQATLVLTLLDDGSIQGPMGLRFRQVKR
jgi:hypothetical protein